MTRDSRKSILSSMFVVWACLLWSVGLSYAQAEVGRTVGSFNVSATGAATYAIPIFSPPGTRGLQPNISLVYNSNSGGGFLGTGWSLSGLSSIRRCNHTVAQDGYASPPMGGPLTHYCLDGNRLRLQTGTQGGSGSTYATEVADYSLTTLTGNVGTTGYWTVQRKDGLTYTYGGTSDSRVANSGAPWWTAATVQWMLSEIVDRSGNKVRFTWGPANTTAHPVKIEWTQTSAGSGSYVYSMDFIYGSNAPASIHSGYFVSGQIYDSALLTGITVSVSGTVKRNYVLTYDTSPSTGAKRLIEVEECSDGAATVCLLPTTITYQNGSAGMNLGSPALNISGNITEANGDYDFDGDGIRDVAYNLSGTWYVRFGSISSGYGSAISTGEVDPINRTRG